MDEIIKQLNNIRDQLGKKADFINASCVMQEELDRALQLEEACARIGDALELLNK